MSDRDGDLDALGANVRRELDASDEVRLDDARERFSRADARPRPSRLGLAIAAAACLVGLLVTLVVGRDAWRARAPIAFEIGAAARAGNLGEWISTDGDERVDLRFSEGTTIALDAGARARVTSADAHGASVLLERGHLAATIVHRDEKTTWSLRAGPFDVQIVGTRFAVDWEPAQEVFALEMQEGTVIVNGPMLDGGRSLVAGQQLRVGVAARELEVGPARPKPRAVVARETPSAPEPAEPTTTASSDIEGGPAASAKTEHVASADRPGYAKLVRAGRIEEALADADRSGFSSVIEQASFDDVSALADAARLAGRSTDARDALLTLRRRFGVRGSSAFLLGKIEAEHPGLGDAATWFDTYLRESPNGAFSEQAMGRLMELRRSRDPGAARALAKRYLERYPRGAYAHLAESLLAP